MPGNLACGREKERQPRKTVRAERRTRWSSHAYEKQEEVEEDNEEEENE